MTRLDRTSPVDSERTPLPPVASIASEQSPQGGQDLESSAGPPKARLIPGAFSRGPPGNTLKIRAGELPGTFKGEGILETNLHEAAVAALGAEFARISARGGNADEKRKLISDALDPVTHGFRDESGAATTARKLGIRHPQLSARSTLAVALFDERLVHEVGPLVSTDEALFEELFQTYLGEIPRMKMHDGDAEVDVVAEEAVNPLASVAVDWAFSRFDDLLPRLIEEGNNDEAANLVLLGHLCGKFDTDPDREKFLSVLAAHRHDGYPTFAKRLVRDRMKYNRGFRKLSQASREFHTVQRKAQESREDYQCIARGGGSPRLRRQVERKVSADEVRSVLKERIAAEESLVLMAEQNARSRLESLRHQLARLLTKLGADELPRAVSWERLSGLCADRRASQRALGNLYRSLRKIDPETITRAELEGFVQMNLAEEPEFNRLGQLLSGTQSKRSPAEQIAMAAHTWLLALADDENGLKPYESDWLLRALETLLKRPPELDDLDLERTPPTFDDAAYKIRKQRAFAMLSKGAEHGWISNRDPRVGKELQNRLAVIEEVLGKSEEVRSILDTHGRFEACQVIARVMGGLSILAGGAYGYLIGARDWEHFTGPLGVVMMAVGLLAWKALSAYSDQRISKRLSRAEQAKKRSLDSSGYDTEIEETKSALFEAAAKWRKGAKFALSASVLALALGWGIGLSEPYWTRFWCGDVGICVNLPMGHISRSDGSAGREVGGRTVPGGATASSRLSRAGEQLAQRVRDIGADEKEVKNAQRLAEALRNGNASAALANAAEKLAEALRGEGSTPDAQSSEQGKSTKGQGKSSKQGRESNKAKASNNRESSEQHGDASKMGKSSQRYGKSSNKSGVSQEQGETSEQGKSSKMGKSSQRHGGKSSNKSGASQEQGESSKQGSSSDQAESSTEPDGAEKQGKSPEQDEASNQSEASNKSEASEATSKDERSENQQPWNRESSKSASEDLSDAVDELLEKMKEGFTLDDLADAAEEIERKLFGDSREDVANAAEKLGEDIRSEGLGDDGARPRFATFRPDNYPVKFWVGAHGFLTDKGEYSWGTWWGDQHQERDLDEHRDFTTTDSLQAAIDQEVAKGRMVVLNMGGPKMEYPVGSHPIEILTYKGQGKAYVEWSALGGVEIEDGGAEAVAIVYEPYDNKNLLGGAWSPVKVHSQEKADPSFYEAYPHVEKLIEQTRAIREQRGPRAAYGALVESIDSYVDAGPVNFRSKASSDNEFIAELMETEQPVTKETPSKAIDLVHDDWTSSHFAPFVHWVDRESGGESYVLTGHRDTGRPGYGPDAPDEIIMYQKNEWDFEAIDVSLSPAGHPGTGTGAGGAQAATPEDALTAAEALLRKPGRVDLAEILAEEEEASLTKVIAYALAGVALLGGAAYGIKRLRRRRSQDSVFAEVAERIEEKLGALPAPASLGVLITIRRAIEFWLNPAPGSPLAEMSEPERVAALTNTYLHEIGLIERPRNETQSEMNAEQGDVFSAEVETAPVTSRKQLGRLLLSLSSEAQRQVEALGPDGPGPCGDGRFAIAQGVLRELAVELSQENNG